MKYWIAVFVLSSVCAFAQQPPPAAKGSVAPTKKPVPAEKKPVSADASQPASREDVARLLEAMQVRKQMESMQQTMLGQFKPMVDRMAGEQLRNMTPQQRQHFNQIVQEMFADQRKAYPPSEMIADIIPIYQKYLTKGDVQHIAAFYASPSGRKLLDNQPEIMRDFMAEVMPKMQERMQASMRKMQDRIQELIRESRAQPGQDREFKPVTPAPDSASPSPATPEPSPTPPPK